MLELGSVILQYIYLTYHLLIVTFANIEYLIYQLTNIYSWILCQDGLYSLFRFFN